MFDRRIVCNVNFLLEFQMYQVQQRIAVLTKSRAKLLAELRELDLLREQVRKWDLGACAGERLDENSDIPLLLNRD